jgi:hypothetical protein
MVFVTGETNKSYINIGDYADDDDDNNAFVGKRIVQGDTYT